MALDGISIRKLSINLKENLIGGQIQKIFQPDSGTIILVVRNHRQEFYLIYSEGAPFANLRISNSEWTGSADSPPSFCMLLRKYLIGGRIGDVAQEGWDRIIKISIDQQMGTKIITRSLWVEMTGRLTNLILVDQDAIILDALHRISENQNTYRTILPHKKYIAPPPQEKCPPDDFEIDRMANALFTQEKGTTVQKVLQRRFDGIGPALVKEMLYSANIDPNTDVSTFSEAIWQTILTSLKDTLHRALDQKESYYFIKENRSTGNISPLLLSHAPEIKQIATPDINSAIVDLIANLGNQNSGRKMAWNQLIEKEISRLKKRLELLQADQEKWQLSPPYQLWGDLIMIHLHEIPQWRSEFTLPNLFIEEYPDLPAEIEVKLNPQKAPLENAQQFYHLQKRMNRSKDQIELQKNQANADLEYLQTLQHYLVEASSPAELEDLQKELISTGLLKNKSNRGSKKSPNSPSKDYHFFTSPSGFPIVVGKNNVQNDQLTFKDSKPYHIWFHAQKIPGSHVILSLPKEMPLEDIQSDLVQAAEIAAYFSKGRVNEYVSVDYTPRKNVWKPNGAKPGYVLYESQKTLYVSPKIEEKST